MVGIKILQEIVGGRPGRKGQRKQLVHFPIKISEEVRGKAVVLKVWCLQSYS